MPEILLKCPFVNLTVKCLIILNFEFSEMTFLRNTIIKCNKGHYADLLDVVQEYF